MFYTICQNNSGGYFIENDDVAEYVCIEANDAYEANDKLYKITEDYSEYCEYCGERWGSFDDRDGKYYPHIYGYKVEEYKSMWRGEIIIYYLDGKKEKLEIKRR